MSAAVLAWPCVVPGVPGEIAKGRWPLERVWDWCWPVRSSNNSSEGLALGKGWKWSLRRQTPEVRILPERRESPCTGTCHLPTPVIHRGAWIVPRVPHVCRLLCAASCRHPLAPLCFLSWACAWGCFCRCRRGGVRSAGALVSSIQSHPSAAWRLHREVCPCKPWGRAGGRPASASREGRTVWE